MTDEPTATTATDFAAIHVSDLLRTGPLGQATIHHLSNDPPVQRLRLIRDYDDLLGVQQDDLLLLALAADEGGWLVDASVRTAWQRWAAAVIVPSHVCLFESPTRLAHRYRIPLLSCDIDDPTDFAAHLGQQISAARTFLLQRCSDTIVALAEVESDPARILEVTSPALGRCTLAVTDRSGHLVAGTLPDWLTSEELAAARADRATLATSGGESATAARALSRPGAWLWPAQQQPWALELDLVLDADGPTPQSWLSAVAAVVAMTCSQLARWSLQQAVELESLTRQQSELLARVLDVGTSIDAATLRSVQHHGWELAAEHIAFHLTVAAEPDAGALGVRHRIQRQLAAAGYHGPLVGWSGGWTGWLSQPDINHEAQQHLALLLEDLSSTDHFTIGLGTPGVGLAGWQTTLRSARSAAQRASHQRTGFVVSGGLPSITVLASKLATIEDPRLAATVQAWLRQGSVQSAAAQLGIHRNTVRTRLERVAAQLGIEIHDPTIRSMLAIAALDDQEEATEY